MKKLLKEFHNPIDRASYTATTIGMHCNHDCQSYGGTYSVRVMIDEHILIHDTQTNVVSWLCGVHTKVNSLLAMLYSCNADIQDFETCMNHISETCAPTRLSKIYTQFIFGNEVLMRNLSDE